MNLPLVVVVSGAARGIGAACCRVLVNRGYRVVATDVDPVSEEVPAAVRLTMDVSDETSVIRAISETRLHVGAIGALVNCAGVNAMFDARTMTVAEWDEFFALDLRASWLTSREVLPDMIGRGAGSIVNVSSIHGAVTLEGFFPYAAAKAGLEGLTRSLALDYGPANIRVNAVAPGFTRTRLVQESLDSNPDPQTAEQRMVSGVALRRMAEPDEIGSVIAFLLSDDASYITGQTIYVDGGLTSRRSGA